MKIRVPKAKRTFFDIQDVKKWKAVKFSTGKEYLARDRNIFLFQMYTGYYYKDLLVFYKEQLHRDHQYGYILLGERDKNGNQIVIPLFKFPYAETILLRYGSGVEERMVFDKKYLVEEPVYNRHLKEIAAMAGISKNVTNKVARHTNAQLWKRLGTDTAVLSKMMGHTKEQTTQNYFDIDLYEIVEGTKKADFAGLGI